MNEIILNPLVAAILVAVACGLIGPFVVIRNLAFAVHGTSELAFTGVAGAMLVGANPLVGGFIGSLIVAAVIGVLGERARERDAIIGSVLAFGLGVGVLFLSFQANFAGEAADILFGDIFRVTADQLIVLLGVSLAVLISVLVIARPLLFASIDPEVAAARGVNTRLIGIIFLVILALTVMSAAWVVGTLLVLSLAITPASAAVRLSARPLVVTALSIGFALMASVGGLWLGMLFGQVRTSFFITFISFMLYIMARVLGSFRAAR